MVVTGRTSGTTSALETLIVSCLLTELGAHVICFGAPSSVYRATASLASPSGRPLLPGMPQAALDPAHPCD
jgi:hypothetical protein